MQTNPLTNINAIRELAFSDTNQALTLISPFIPCYARHLSDILPQLETSTNHELTLSMIYFNLKKYDRAIKLYIEQHKNNRAIDKSIYDPLYYIFFEKAIFRRMLDVMNDEIKEFVIQRAQDDPLLVTFFMRDPKVLSIFMHRIDLRILKRVAEVQKCLPEFYMAVKQANINSHDIHTLRIIVDALVYYKEHANVIALIENLILVSLPLCYELCFYINESYFDFLCMEQILSIGDYKSLEQSESIKEEENEIQNYKADINVKTQIVYVLTGELKRNIFLSAMDTQNKTDFSFLNTLIKPVQRYSSILSVIGYANSIMNMGTSNDTFVKANSEALSEAKHWNKYMALSSLGMIHCNNSDPVSLLYNLLPNENLLEEGGLLLGVGLIEYNKKALNDTVVAYLSNILSAKYSKKLPQTLIQGAALGLGCLHMARRNMDVTKTLIKTLEGEDVLGAEGAAYSLGLNMLGCGIGDNNSKRNAVDIVRSIVKEVAMSPSSTPTLRNRMKETRYLEESRDEDTENTTDTTQDVSQAKGNDSDITDEKKSMKCLVDKLKTISHDSEHERVSRAAGIALSLMVVQTKVIDNVTRKLLTSRTDTSRYAGCFCIGSAFVGTSDLNAISLLLDLLNDNCEDVKRACVLALAFVCCNNKTMLFDVLSPLATNHSASVRGAVGLGLGYFCQGYPGVVDLVEVLMYDVDLLVKQSAFIGMGFLLTQGTKAEITNFKRIVQRINYALLEKNENTSALFGAVLGRSIMEGGGRNVIFGVNNLYGQIDKFRVAGAIMFFQFHYNYAAIGFLGITMLPTFHIVLNKNFVPVEDEIQIEGLRTIYNVNKIKVPKPKTKRRLRRRYKPEVEAEVIEESSEEVKHETYTIKEGERYSFYENQSQNWGFIFRE